MKQSDQTRHLMVPTVSIDINLFFRSRFIFNVLEWKMRDNMIHNSDPKDVSSVYLLVTNHFDTILPINAIGYLHVFPLNSNDLNASLRITIILPYLSVKQCYSLFDQVPIHRLICLFVCFWKKNTLFKKTAALHKQEMAVIFRLSQFFQTWRCLF